MNDVLLKAIPEHLHAAAQMAVSSAFGSGAVTAADPVPGGASGALTFRIETAQRCYLLRMETGRGPLRNPHQYTCMRIAAEAGIAPPVRYADDSVGVAIMDFVIQRPLQEYPGGPRGLAAAIGKLAADLQATEAFPVLREYPVLLDRMLGYLQTVVAPGLLDLHREAFNRIRDAYPWADSIQVSSRNDPNPGNILYDGERLWLVDWETACRNDALTDIAILTENHAPAPELEDVLLQAWFGAPPDRAMRARLVLMRKMTRLYYAAILLALSVKPSAPLTDLSAPDPDEFRRRIAAGQLKPGTTETMVLLGKMCLAGFLTGLAEPSFGNALVVAQGG